MWKKVIFNGNYIKDWIVAIYKKEKEELKNQLKEKKVSNLINLIGNWRNFNSNDFKPLYDKVKQEFVDGKYLHPGAILLYFNYFYIFSQWGLIPDTQEELQSCIEKFLESYKEKIIALSDWYIMDMGYGGYAFSNDIEQVRDLKKRLKDINTENYMKSSKDTFEKEIKQLSDDCDDFIKNIIHVNGNNKYYKQPILSFIDIESFYSKLVTLSGNTQQRIIHAFEERYGKVYGNEPFDAEYAPDIDNLKELYKLYYKNQTDITFNPQKLFEKTMINKLGELVSYMERKIANFTHD